MRLTAGTKQMSTFFNEFNSQLNSNLVALSKKIIEKYGEVDGLEKTITEYLSSQSINIGGKDQKTDGKKSATKDKPKKERTVVEKAPQCEGRIWGSLHDGNERCSFSAGPNGLCTKHAKAEAECCIPCSYSPDGEKRLGLFYGRINQFQEGEPNIPPYKDTNNIVRIQWNSDIIRSHISNEIEKGRCRLLKKPKATKTRPAAQPTKPLPFSNNEALTILELDHKASSADIKQKYHALAREFHPDKIPESYTEEERLNCEERFKQISAAWEILQRQYN